MAPLPPSQVPDPAAPRPPIFHAGSSTRPAPPLPAEARPTGTDPSVPPSILMAEPDRDAVPGSAARPLVGPPQPFDRYQADLRDALDAADHPRLLGLPVWTAGRAALFAHLTERVAELDAGQRAGHTGRPVDLHSVNAEISIQVRGDARYRELLAKNPINLPDGEWVRRLVRLKHGATCERISGSDMVVELCELAAREGWPVFLLGARDEVSRAAAAELRARFGGLEVERFSPPYQPGPTLSPAATAEALARIASARPTVLMTFLGSPKQELWTRAHEQALATAGVRIVLGAGAGLDFVAGAVRRAPARVSALGLEWAWRLALQPRARLGRALRRLPAFALLGLADALVGRAARLLRAGTTSAARPAPATRHGATSAATSAPSPRPRISPGPHARPAPRP